MDISEKYSKLIEAFTDEAFQKELDDTRIEIEREFKSIAENFKRVCNRINNIFSVESRVKTRDSFEEKLFRKNYINTWDVKEDKLSNQELIRHELIDIIGIRINCYFEQFENVLYSGFEKEQENLAKRGFVLNMNENLIQKNGHKIFKFSGIMNDTYRFEVQIKSVIHNVWGEAEHKTVYKNLSYDGYIEEKKTITRSLYDILHASEDQLYSLFSMEETEDQLIRSLFFCQTKVQIAQDCKTRILAYHYQNYFRSFSNIEEIKAFVVAKLNQSDYQPTDVTVTGARDYLIKDVKEQFPVFYLDCLYKIDSIIHNHNSFDSFLSYFLEKTLPEIEKDEFDEDDNDAFADYEDDDSENHVTGLDSQKEEFMQKINMILDNCKIKK